MEIKEYNETQGSLLKTGLSDEDRVLAFIVSIGSSFPSEMGRRLSIDMNVINSVIYKLINKELIKVIIPERWYPQPLIMCRMKEMRAHGINSYESFVRRNWYIAAEKGFWYVADKFKGEHRRANEAYIETYPNIKYEFKSISQS